MRQPDKVHPGLLLVFNNSIMICWVSQSCQGDKTFLYCSLPITFTTVYSASISVKSTWAEINNTGCGAIWFNTVTSNSIQYSNDIAGGSMYAILIGC